MNHKLITGTIAALFASVAMAQSTSTTMEHPKPIATSQQTADEAAAKAAESGATTAKFVRTGPSAANHVGSAASKTKAKAGRAKDKMTDDTNDASTHGVHSTTGSGMSSTSAGSGTSGTPSSGTSGTKQ